MHEEFTPEMKTQRNSVLRDVADNTLNARRIIETLNNSNPEH